MSRGLAAADRIATAVFGMLLLACGAALIAWQQGYPEHLADSALNTRALHHAVTSGWYPWASASTAILVAILTLWWLYAHLRTPQMSEPSLQGSNTTGRFTVKPNSAAAAAAASFADTPGIASAKGTALIERGTPLVIITAAATPRLAIPDTLPAAAQLRDDVQSAMDTPGMPVRIELKKLASDRTRVQ